MTSAPTPPDDHLLSAWLDGELDDAQHEQVNAWLRDHPDDAARVRLWAADRDALRARFDPVLGEPVPQHLLDTVQQHVGRATWRTPRVWLQAAAAAGLLVGGGVLGALLAPQLGLEHGLQARGDAAQGAPAQVHAVAAAPAWTQRAAVAHAVYVPEVRHPVDVNVAEGDPAQQRAQEEHLVKWLSKRLALPVKLFDLRSQGYSLVGGRLLPDASGPSAQLMYQDASGQRVTVYMRKPDDNTDAAFRYEREGELGLFYWVEGGYGCALVGELPRERLLALAEAVYKQAEDGGVVQK